MTPRTASQGAAHLPVMRLDTTDPALMEEMLDGVARVAATGAFTLGHEVEAFEAEFAAYNETEHSVGLSSGTEALVLALRALEIGRGDEVIVPANSFIATAEAVSLVGATPRPIDVDPDSHLMTGAGVEAAIGPRTRCVIPVHLMGSTVDLDPILALAKDAGLRVIEDTAQAHGAHHRGRRAGSIGDFGCFSFYPTKNLGAWGDGGAIVTPDEELAAKIRLLRSHGESPRHHHQLVTGTHRLDALQAAILDVKLRHLDEWNASRQAAAAKLTEALADCDVVLPTAPAEDGDHVYHLFVITTPERDALRDHLDACGVSSAIHYPTPVHLQPAYADLGLGLGSLPVAERLAGESCSLPVFPAIEDWHIAETAAAVQSFGAAGNS